MAGKRGGSEEERKLHEYLVAKSFRPTAPLLALQKASLEHKRSLMVSPPDSIAILSLILKMIGARVAVEVGVFTGYTSLGIASALPQDGKLYALDISEEYASIGKPYWEQAGVADRIDLRIAPAKDTLKNLLQELGPGSVDLGFIDADKSNYDTYYELLLKLLRPGGVVVVDNVLWSGNVVNDADQSPDTQAIRALNDKIFKDERVHPAMLKNSDGITVAVKL